MRIEASGQRAVPVTPSDSVDLTMLAGTGYTKGLYVGVSGDLKVDMSDGSTVTFVGLASGMIHPVAARRVYATGTTATNIVAVY